MWPFGDIVTVLSTYTFTVISTIPNHRAPPEPAEQRIQATWLGPEPCRLQQSTRLVQFFSGSGRSGAAMASQGTEAKVTEISIVRIIISFLGHLGRVAAFSGEREIQQRKLQPTPRPGPAAPKFSKKATPPHTPHQLQITFSCTPRSMQGAPSKASQPHAAGTQVPSPLTAPGFSSLAPAPQPHLASSLDLIPRKPDPPPTPNLPLEGGLHATPLSCL